MINLTDLMQPVDIRVNSDGNGYIIIECRQALYNQVKEELKNTVGVCGIPIVLISEIAAESLGKTRTGTQIQLVTHEVNLDQKVLAKRIAEYYQSKGMLVAF